MKPVRQRSRELVLDCPKPEQLELEQLQDWHRRGLELWRQQQSGDSSGYSWLEIKLALAQRLLNSCNYCVHNCRVNRWQQERGYCQLDAQPRISGSYLHWGEEAPISPTWAVFFSGCTMHCLYCHNWRETFDLQAGAVIQPAELAAEIAQAQERYRTISLIGGTPEPQLHTIIELAQALGSEVMAPLVFNSNATLSAAGLELMEGLIDIYLPDFKHGNNRCAWQLTKIAHYLESLQLNLKAYLEQGAAVLVRHLVVPGHLECCTRPVLEILARDYPELKVNVMFQYRPMYKAEQRPELNRSLENAEETLVRQWVQELGINQLK